MEALGLPSNHEEVGGLFVAPDVGPWLGRQMGDEVITPENLPRILYEHTHVVVNGGAWCSDRERIRAVFSLPREKIEAAARALASFREAMQLPALHRRLP